MRVACRLMWVREPQWAHTCTLAPEPSMFPHLEAEAPWARSDEGGFPGTLEVGSRQVSLQCSLWTRRAADPTPCGAAGPARLRPGAVCGPCAASLQAVLLRSPGVHFEVKRVELQGPAPLFCCWLVRDLHGPQASALRTHLPLASWSGASHSACELPGLSVGEVGAGSVPGAVPAAPLCLLGVGRGSACGIDLSSDALCKDSPRVGP